MYNLQANSSLYVESNTVCYLVEGYPPRFITYLEEKEAKWADSRDQYQAEIVRQGQQITDILQRLHIYNDEPSTSRRQNDRPRTAEIVNSVLMKRRCQEEHAMALDFARQSKISELKLLLIQQQGYIQRLQLKNSELNGVIRDVLYAKSEETPENDDCQLQNVSDVLTCDEAGYIPNKSTDPDIVCRQVFNIGETKTSVGPTFPVFDPRKLSYICLDALPVHDVIQVEECNEDEETNEKLNEEISSEIQIGDNINDNKQTIDSFGEYHLHCQGDMENV